MIESLPRPIRGVVSFARDFVLALGEHAVYSHAAALAFYLIFSIPPALLGIVALAGMLPVESWVTHGLENADEVLTWAYGLVLDPVAAAASADGILISWTAVTDTLRDLDKEGMLLHLRQLLEENAPRAVAETAYQFLKDVLGNAQPGLLTVGFVGVLWSASGVTRQVLRAVNAIHELRPRPWWRQNLVALGMTLALLGCGTLALILLPVSGAVIGVLGGDEWWMIAWRVATGSFGVLVMYTVMQTFYRWAVHAKLPGRRTREGVILTMALWGTLFYVLGRFGQQGLERYSATYGALASIVFLLFWIYAMAISLFLGVEWNATRLSQGPWWEVLLGDRARKYTRRAAERASFARGPWGGRAVHSPPQEEAGDETRASDDG